jgi:hypothetical protein
VYKPADGAQVIVIEVENIDMAEKLFPQMGPPTRDQLSRHIISQTVLDDYYIRVGYRRNERVRLRLTHPLTLFPTSKLNVFIDKKI